MPDIDSGEMREKPLTVDGPHETKASDYIFSAQMAEETMERNSTWDSPMDKQPTTFILSDRNAGSVRLTEGQQQQPKQSNAMGSSSEIKTPVKVPRKRKPAPDNSEAEVIITKRIRTPSAKVRDMESHVNMHTESMTKASHPAAAYLQRGSNQTSRAGDEAKEKKGRKGKEIKAHR